MTKLLRRAALLLVLLMLLTGGAQAENEAFAFVACGPIPLLTEPDETAAQSSWAASGEWVRVLQTQNGWCEVEQDGEETGWLEAAYLAPGLADITQTAEALAGAVLYAAPSKTADVLAPLDKETALLVTGEQGRFLAVQAGDQTGYVLASLCKLKGMAADYCLLVTPDNASQPLRAAPWEGAPVLMDCAAGTEVDVLAYGWRWDKVRVQGRIGFVEDLYLSERSYSDNTDEDATDMPVDVLVTYALAAPADGLLMNVYAEPDDGAAVAFTILEGDSLEALAQDENWSEIYYYGLHGYAHTAELTPLTTGAASAANGEGTLRDPDGAETVSLRQNPAWNAPVVAEYPTGTAAQVMEYGADWCLVRVEGWLAYASTYALSFEP